MQCKCKNANAKCKNDYCDVMKLLDLSYFFISNHITIYNCYYSLSLCKVWVKTRTSALAI